MFKVSAPTTVIGPSMMKSSEVEIATVGAGVDVVGIRVEALDAGTLVGDNIAMGPPVGVGVVC